MKTEQFILTDEHIRLLRAAYIGWEVCEFGAPAIDCKRPYGNSDVVRDICEILDWPLVETREGTDCTPEQEERARQLHSETQTALQVILTTGSFVAGTYAMTRPYDYRSWKLQNQAPM